MNCIEKYRKLRTHCFLRNTVILRGRKESPVERFARLVMTSKLYLNVMLATANCISVVAEGVSNSPSATRNGISSPSLSLRTVRGANNPSILTS